MLPVLTVPEMNAVAAAAAASIPLDELVGRAGLAVATWTVDDAETMGAVADAGVDTVITDDVPLAVGVLSGRAGNG